MALKLMYITNRPDVARIAEKNGVDRIFVDMEYIGKAERQGRMDTVQNHHTIDDVRKIRSSIKKAELLVRVNPIHAASADYCSSKEEIEAVIEAGADIVMLPYFKTMDEIREFLDIVDGRTGINLLLETKEAAELLDEIMMFGGFDEIHIGLNDLAISRGKKFLFESLTDGTVERLCRKMEGQRICYGFGGIASLGRGLVPAEMIFKEHYRLGSRMVILSRSFCNIMKVEDLNAVEEIFYRGVREIRALEKECQFHKDYFVKNQLQLSKAVEQAVRIVEESKS